MKFPKSYLFSLFGILLVLQVVSFLPESNSTLFTILALLHFMVILLWIFILYRTSTIRHARFGKVFYIILALYFIGALCKLQHWPFAGTILFSSIALAMMAYTIWFFIKGKYQLTDLLKLLWFEGYLSLALVKLQHWPFDNMQWINDMIFLFLIGSFCYNYQNKKEVDLT